MNCTQFRKYAGAFADGELDIPLNLEALEHLNMCPACTQRVDEITSLRSALERTHAEHRAPEDLRERIHHVLEEERRTLASAKSNMDPKGVPRVVRTRPTSRWLIPLSMAAAVMVAVSAWQYSPRAELSSGTITTLAVRIVADAARIHRHCASRRVSDHHDPSLPRNLAQLASQLSERLGFEAIAPDFSSSGFALVGADFCALGGRKTAHVLYRRQAEPDIALSVFSTRRIPELRPEGVTALGDTDVFVRRVGDLTIAAWYRGGQSFTFCSELDELPLLRAVDQIRVAQKPPGTQPQAWLAFAGGGLPR